MMNITSALIFTVSFSLFLGSLVNAQINSCGDKCRFRLCQPIGPVLPKGSRVLLRPPPAVSFGVICRSGLSIGFVRSTGEAILEFRNGDEIPISQWRPKGLSPKFSKKFFTAGREQALKRSGITSAQLRGRQQKFLENLCVRLPIKSYESVDKRTGRVKRVVKTDGEDTDCVSFRTRTTSILVELRWTSNDDLDLFLTEPDGTQLSRFNPETMTGRLNGDFTADGCTRPFKSGRESARYLATSDGVKKGRYQVQARHFNNCGGGPTRWTIRIIINGKLIKTARGTSDGNTDEVIGMTSFNF